MLDEETARWVRVEAARSDMSVSRFIAQMLEERRRNHQLASVERFVARRPRKINSGRRPYPTRDELHDRGRLR